MSYWIAHGPIALVTGAIFTGIFCGCLRPNDSEVTGPSGSSMLCLGYLLLNWLFWIPEGAVVISFQRDRGFYSSFTRRMRWSMLLLTGILLALAFSDLPTHSDDGGAERSDAPRILLLTMLPNLVAMKFLHLLTGGPPAPPVPPPLPPNVGRAHNPIE